MRAIGVSPETLEARALLARLVVIEGGVAGIAQVDPVFSQNVVNLGESDVHLPGPPTNTNFLADARPQFQIASVLVDWTNSARSKTLDLRGVISTSNSDPGVGAPAGHVSFGTSGRFVGVQPASNYGILLKIEPEGNEVPGTPIDVTLDSTVTTISRSQVPDAVDLVSGTGSYEVQYSDDPNRVISRTIDSGDYHEGINSTRSVTVHTVIGASIAFGAKADASVPAINAGMSAFVVRSSGFRINLVATVGVPQPALSVTRVQSVSAKPGKQGSSSLIVAFSGPLDERSAEAVTNYRITAGKAKVRITSASYDSSTNQVTLQLSRVLQAGEKATVTVVGAGIKDIAGQPIDGEGRGKPGSDHVAVVAGIKDRDLARKPTHRQRHRHKPTR